MTRSKLMVLSALALCIPGLTPRLARAFDFSANGFASFHAILPLQKDTYLSYPEYTEGRLDLTSGSLLGLNLRADVAPGWSAIAQLTARGSSDRLPGLHLEPDWKPSADWFYAVYNPLDGLNFKIGRQTYPSWLTSEFIDVGLAYPWRSPPEVLYRIAPLKAFNGMTAEYRHALASGISLTGSLFGGEEEITNSYGSDFLANIDCDNLMGATLTLNGEGWRARASVTRARVEAKLDVGMVAINGPVGVPLIMSYLAPKLTVYSVGARYDKNNWVAYAEYGRLSSLGADIIETSGQAFLDSAWGTYGALGYRIGPFLPWYMIAYGDHNLGFETTHSQSLIHSLGLNYQIAPALVLKAQYDRQTSRNGLMNLNQAGTADTLALGVDLVF